MLSNNLQLKHSEIFILQIFHFFIIASSGFKLIVIFWLVYEYELWSCEYCKHIYRKRQNPKAEKWKQIIIVGVVSSIYQNHPNPKAEKCRKCIILGVVSSIYRNHQNPKAEKWKKYIFPGVVSSIGGITKIRKMSDMRNTVLDSQDAFDTAINNAKNRQVVGSKFF